MNDINHAAKKVILLAEDDDFDSELTIKALEKNSLDNSIIRVADGEDVLDYLNGTGKYKNSHRPCVLLMDLKMPKLNGIEVLKIIKSDKNLKNLPVVILSSSCADDDLKKCYDLHVNAFVIKPVDFHELVAALKEIAGFWSVYNRVPD